jgi:hypothetical protein
MIFCSKKKNSWCGVTTTSPESMDRVQETTHSTGHVPTEDNRPATIHREHPTRLYLPARRRTTFTVQSLRRGSVDHERLRNDKHSLPSRTFERFLKNLRILMILVQPNKKCESQGNRVTLELGCTGKPIKL